jgi:hypothetical protein
VFINMLGRRLADAARRRKPGTAGALSSFPPGSIPEVTP